VGHDWDSQEPFPHTSVRSALSRSRVPLSWVKASSREHRQLCQTLSICHVHKPPNNNVDLVACACGTCAMCWEFSDHPSLRFVSLPPGVFAWILRCRSMQSFLPSFFFFLLLKTSLFRTLGVFPLKITVFVPHRCSHSHPCCTGVGMKLSVVQRKGILRSVPVPQMLQTSILISLKTWLLSLKAVSGMILF